MPIGQSLLAEAQQYLEDANLWMNLSVVMQILGQREIGVQIQSQALELKRVYTLAAAQQPAVLRVLMLVAPGDVAANTPLDCLLENSDIDLIFYYLTPNNPFAEPIPDHDVLMVAVGETTESKQYLTGLAEALADWPKPIVNLPQYIPATDREVASQQLQAIPGLLMPPTHLVSRQMLNVVASQQAPLVALVKDCQFPLILRPMGSQAGRGLERIDTPAAIADYLTRVEGEVFFLSQFIDYSSPDGQFRKYRIALIDGQPFACHMAISANWMVHYVNAGMYDEAAKRQEEAHFMDTFPAFAQRHATALAAIQTRIPLDYLLIDCAETQDGQLFIFEVDHAMVVHAMDPPDLFPYKQHHMQKVREAMRQYLCRRAGVALPQGGAA